MSDTKDYAIAATGSIVFHVVLVAVGLFFAPTTSPLVSVEPNIIRAQLVSADQLNIPEAQPQQRIIDLTRAPPAPEVQVEDRLQMPPEEVVESEPEPEPEPEPETEEVVEVTRDRAAEERAAQEERDRLEQEQRQNELNSELQAELAAIENSENQQLVMSYASWISERVGNNWSRPPSARSGMIVELRVNLVPTGRVVSVDVVETSGDAAFDRSAVQAVHKAEPYTRLTELSPELFDEQFRQFNFLFNPQDLRL